MGLGLKIYTGSAAPDWLYQAGVPEVRMAEGGSNKSYPYYPNQVYQDFYFR